MTVPFILTHNHVAVYEAFTSAAKGNQPCPSNEAIAKTLGVCDKTVGRIVDALAQVGYLTVKGERMSRVVTIAATGKSTQATGWSAADLDRLKGMIAAHVSMKDAAEALGRSEDAVKNAARRNKLGTFTSHVRQIPADFAKRWRTMTQEQLCQHYGMGRGTCARFVNELGLKRDAGSNVRPVAKAKKVKSSTFTLAAPVERPVRDMSKVGQAVDYLRRHGPVFRCNPRGGADVKGTHWRRGSAVLTDAEIVERAERLGWSSDAWARIAA